MRHFTGLPKAQNRSIAYLTVLDFWIVHAVGQQHPPELCDPVGVWPVVVPVVGQGPQQVELDLLGRRTHGRAGRGVVGQQLLVVVGLEVLVGGAHQLVVHDGLPHGALGGGGGGDS